MDNRCAIACDYLARIWYIKHDYEMAYKRFSDEITILKRLGVPESCVTYNTAFLSLKACVKSNANKQCF